MPRPTPRWTLEPLPVAEVPPPGPVHISVPSVHISAPIVDGHVDAEKNQMIAPEGYDVIAWYRYSAVPGSGGNAVFAGHLDQREVGPAVLWRLRDVRPGDEVELHLQDGSRLTYRVDSNEKYHMDSGPWSTLFRPTAEADVITLYTCDAPFEDGEYQSRRVVQATLVARTAPAREWHELSLN